MVSILTNERNRTKFQYTVVFFVLGFVALVMTIVNIITQKGALTWATGIFSLLCFLNLIIVINDNKGVGMFVSSILFMVEIVALFVFFIISGNPDGFSVLWMAMLPACGMLLFGIRKTSILCFVLFLILVFFFWIPFGNRLLQYEYNSTFMMRFPILFVAFFAMSTLLETIRELTQRELDKLREKYKTLSSHDHLTGLLNRQGLFELVRNAETDENQTVFMIDIDHFKEVNDSYGHDAGDIVLKKIAHVLCSEADGAEVCRWGGEEFVIWYPKDVGDPEAIRQSIEAMSVVIPDYNETVNTTISIGVAYGDENIEDLINRADKALYQAKENGRNRIEWA